MFENAAKETKYMVYSTKFDRECRIGDLVDGEVVERLDRHFEFHGFEDAEAIESGLSGVRDLDIGDDVEVAFLVDMSGSMLGRPVNEVCQAVLATTLALEDLGAAVSVLGYTTGSTNRPAREFSRDRAIRQPGRLSEAVFVVAKETGRPAANEIGSILALGVQDLNMENLDGEAVVWAARRLDKSQAGRKILILVTDGFEPYCDASIRAAADRAFMKKHLKAVAAELDASEDIVFAQVVLAEDYQLARQDTYTSPVISKTKAPDIAKAIVEAIRPTLSHRMTPVAAPAV